MEALKLKRKTCRPVVADLHHLDEKQDPDPDLSQNSDQDRHLSEKMETNPHLINEDTQSCRRLWFNLFKILTRLESTL
jgi:hypothetical protein